MLTIGTFLFEKYSYSRISTVTEEKRTVFPDLRNSLLCFQNVISFCFKMECLALIPSCHIYLHSNFTLINQHPISGIIFIKISPSPYRFYSFFSVFNKLQRLPIFSHTAYLMHQKNPTHFLGIFMHQFRKLLGENPCIMVVN